MASSKCLTIVLLFLSVHQSHQQGKVDCTYKSNCGTTTTIATITCEKTFTGMDPKDCQCTGTLCGGTLDVTGITYANVKDSQCKQWCTDQKSAQCNFWKYTNLMEAPTTTTCYLLTNCEEEMTGVECPTTHDDGQHTIECISDMVEGGECEDGTDNGPTPSGPTCPGPITQIVNQPDKYVQGWKCFEPATGKKGINFIDMYAADAVMPLGGFCKLDDNLGGSCKEDTLRMNCALEDPSDPTSTKWIKAESSMDDGDVYDDEDTTKLKDVTCAAAPLKNIAKQTGRDIVCTQGDMTEETPGGGTYMIPAENDCLMLCDGFDVLSFYTDWDADAVTNRGWWFKVSESEMDPVKMTADILDCWGKRV